MDKKKKFRIVVIVPVIATLIVAGMSVYFVLQVGAGGQKGTVYSAEMADASAVPHEDNHEVQGVDDESSCGFAEWVGKSVDESAVKSAGRPYRVLAPDSMATMDSNPQRINVMTDDEGIVIAVRCG